MGGGGIARGVPFVSRDSFPARKFLTDASWAPSGGKMAEMATLFVYECSTITFIGCTWMYKICDVPRFFIFFCGVVFSDVFRYFLATIHSKVLHEVVCCFEIFCLRWSDVWEYVWVAGSLHRHNHPYDWLPQFENFPRKRKEEKQVKILAGNHIFPQLLPRSLTWNLKISPWKRRFLLETIIFRFHVKFQWCTSFWQWRMPYHLKITSGCWVATSPSSFRATHVSLRLRDHHTGWSSCS